MRDFLSAVYSGIAKNRGPIGSGLLALVVWAQTNPAFDSHPWVKLAAGGLGVFLMGAGFVKSDSYHKENS